MDMHIIKYCAEECERQGSGTLSVYNMCVAWEYAQEHFSRCPKCYNNPEVHDRENPRLTVEFIERLGELVEPSKNRDGFRTIPIFVGNGFEMVEKAPFDRIGVLLPTLLESYYVGNLAADERLIGARTNNDWDNYKHYKKANSAEDIFYYEYENIHPFRDGNGRTGKIIYNYLKGTLDNPEMPPNFWNSSNP